MERHAHPAERRWVWGFAGLTLLITSLPYFIGFATQGQDWRFTGFVFGIEDGNSYVAKMLAGASGAWLFRTPYTPLPQRGVIVFLPYILLGKLAAPPGLHTQLVVLYHIFRSFTSLLVIWAAYDFLAYFVRQVRLRRLGLVLATLGGGLGWVLVLAGKNDWLGSLPLDFYSPETFGFLGLWGIAHLPLARAALLWALLAWLEGPIGESTPHSAGDAYPTRKEWRQAAKLSAWWLISLLAQPLVGGLIGLVIALHMVVLTAGLALRKGRHEKSEWQRLGRAVKLAIVSGIVPVGFILVMTWSLTIDPFLRSWSAQNIIRSPHPWHYLLAYGLILPFALLGAFRLLRRRNWPDSLPVVWAAALPFLAYAPITLQRRLPEGMWVVLLVLALAALDSRVPALEAGGLTTFNLVEDQKIQYLRKTFLAITPLLFISTLFLLAGGLRASWTASQPAFLPAKEVQAFETLANLATSGPVVLAAYSTGNALPAWAPVRVVIGHGPESSNLADLQGKVRAFYTTSMPEKQRLELLHAMDVAYIIWGPNERALGDWDPARAAYLWLVIRESEYAVYEVLPGQQ
jgi:hypothetical protein